MKKIYPLLTALMGMSLAGYAQTTTVTVDANDVLNSNNKIVIQTGIGQSFFTGHQLGSGYTFYDGIFRAISDNPSWPNTFYDGLRWNGSGYTTTFRVTSDGTGYFAGNVGIGTFTPYRKLDLSNSGQLTFGDDVVTSSSNGIYWHSGSDYGIYRTSGAWSGNSYQQLRMQFTTGIELGAGVGGGGYDKSYVNVVNGKGLMVSSGSLGVGTTNPASLFQVDDGCTKASIGDASGSALNYGTSYLGFNASRSGNNWLTNSDGGNNGGGVIYSSIFGDMYFSTVPTTGGSGQTLSDANIANNIAMKINHTDGAVYMKQAYVQTSGFPDYVFKRDYHLRSLSEVKSYIDQNQHLPDMPAAATVEKDGLNLGEMNKALLKKVEELTLYLIEKDREIKDQQETTQKQQEEIQTLKAEMQTVLKTKRPGN